jgi:hypothetical protein
VEITMGAVETGTESRHGDRAEELGEDHSSSSISENASRCMLLQNFY